MTRRLSGLLALIAALAVWPVWAQMPDARQMSGVPLPVGELAVGTVTVRVVRGAMTNPIVNQPVELIGGAAPARGQTNDAGRAEFSGFAPGTRLRAVTIVDGEQLESQEFTVPSTGGVRLALVAAAGAAAGAPSAVPPAAPSAPPAAQPGTVILGDQTRFVVEMGEDGLNVFNIIQIVNGGSAPVQTPSPLVFDLPADAQGPGMLDGSSPQATLAGKQVIVTGPFAAGATLVQFAYSIPFGSESVTIAQPLPADLDHVAVVLQRVGATRLQSPQLSQQQEMPAGGQSYIAARGPALRAGTTLAFTISGLPHHSPWPLNVALALAVVILAGGAWAATGARKATVAEAARRQRLHAKRDKLFEELVALEARQRDRSIAPGRDATRRAELIAALERIYADLDEEAAA